MTRSILILICSTLLLGCQAAAPPTPQAEATTEAATPTPSPTSTVTTEAATPNPSPTVTTVKMVELRGKKFDIITDSTNPCQLPQSIADSELFNRFLTAEMGSSPQEVQDKIGKPPDRTHSSSSTRSEIAWVEKLPGDVSVDYSANFGEGKLDERAIAAAENMGQSNETSCFWRAVDAN